MEDLRSACHYASNNGISHSAISAALIHVTSDAIDGDGSRLVLPPRSERHDDDGDIILGCVLQRQVAKESGRLGHVAAPADVLARLLVGHDEADAVCRHHQKVILAVLDLKSNG